MVDEKIGYYLVNDKKFANKAQAIEEASRNGLCPSWVFNPSQFGAAAWDQEPVESISTLYAQRARQLREKYQYLVLNYSAGSDSQNILDTFIDYGIKLDEVLVRWPERANKSLYAGPTTDLSATNFHSEWELAILPKLEQLRQRNPEIKIEFYDYSDEGHTFYNNADWLYTSNACHLNPCAGFMYYLGLPKYQRMAEKGITVGHIFGVDKPRVILEGDTFYTYFLDILTGVTHITTDHTFNEYNHIELFYWSPDAIPLLRKQCHLIMDFFKSNRGLLHLLNFKDNTVEKRTNYEIVTRNLIYPTWRKDTFQVKKPSTVFYCEYDDWFMKLYKDSAPLVIWQETLDYIQKTTDKKFLTFNDSGRMDNFVGMISPFYKLGTL